MAKPFRERNPIVVGLVSIAVLAVLMLFALSLNRLTFLRGVDIIEADFADASGLTPENEVRIAGLKVGKVRKVELKGDRVRVSMEISRGVKLGNATTAEIKLKTILGSKFMDIAPKGGAPFIEGGDRIPLERTTVPFELYEVTNRTVETIGKLDAEALNDMLRELGKLFDDPEGNFGRALDGLAEVSTALSERDAELESLVRSSGTLLDTLGNRSAELGRILENGGKLLDELSKRRAGVERFARSTNDLADELAGLLNDTRKDLDPALRSLHTVLEVVAANPKELEESLRVLGPSAESFARTANKGNWVDLFTETLIGIPIPPGLTLEDLLGSLA